MIARLLAVVAAALMLVGCQQEASTTPPSPVALTTDAMGLFCGMNLKEHPGPKGQILTAGRIDPFWFSSARDAIAFTLMPDQPRDIRAVYVSDMGKAESWQNPGEANWIDARKAFFVIESKRQGGMGGAEAVPFGERSQAQAFAEANGGRVVTFSEIPPDYVLGTNPADEAGESPTTGSNQGGGHD